jgi:hypothetical protein
LRYIDPRRFGDLLDTERPCAGGELGISAADVALLRDDLAAAAAGYRDALRRGPAEPDVWSGLALAVRDRPSDPAATFLSGHVPLVRALHGALHSAGGETPDPLALAGWLARGAYRVEQSGRYASRSGAFPGSTS